MRLGAWSPGKLMLQRLAVGLTPPPELPRRRGSVVRDSSIPLASVTAKEPSALTRYRLWAWSAGGGEWAGHGDRSRQGRVEKKEGDGEAGKGKEVAQICFAEKPQVQVEAVEDETCGNAT